MSVAPARNFTRLAVAIVIAALVISASALSYASFEATVTRTVVTGTTIITTQTNISNVSSTVTPMTEVTDTACSNADVNPPSNLFTDAPISGYTYVIVYNTTNGAVLSGQTQLSCELGGKLPTLLAFPAGVNQTTASKEEAPLNVTSDPELRPMDTNGYSNAFYVNLQTKQLAVIPGITFSNSYQQAFYNGQPITNGTRLAIPPQ